MTVGPFRSRPTKAGIRWDYARVLGCWFVCAASGACAERVLAEGEFSQASGALVDYPEFDTPMPEGGDCARFRWLPVGMRIAALSHDGRTVVGTARGRAVIWRAEEVILLDPGTEAVDVGETGDLVAGNARRKSENATDAFLWRRSTGMTIIQANAEAVAVSHDGSAVVGNRDEEFEYYGYSYDARHAFIWYPEHGTQDLPLWWNFNASYGSDSEGPFPWEATAASPDVPVVLGLGNAWFVGCRECEGNFQLWSGFGTIPYAFAGHIHALARPGRVAVGETWPTRGVTRAARWDIENERIEELDFTGFEWDRYEDPGRDEEIEPYSSSATAVSADGSVILGETAMWREHEGTRAIADVLADACIDTEALLPGALWYGAAVSGDLDTLVGCARWENEDYCWMASNLML